MDQETQLLIKSIRNPTGTLSSALLQSICSLQEGMQAGDHYHTTISPEKCGELKNADRDPAVAKRALCINNNTHPRL